MSLAKKKSLKQLLWVGMGSIVMFFAGLTSAYIVRKGEGNWFNFELPNWFWISTVIIILSSILLVLAKGRIKQERASFTAVSGVFLLGLLFCFSQFKGWQELNKQGVYLTGDPVDKTMTVSYFNSQEGLKYYNDSLKFDMKGNWTQDSRLTYSQITGQEAQFNKGVMPDYNFMAYNKDTNGFYLGCLDSTGINYNIYANQNNGNCYYKCDAGTTVFSTLQKLPCEFNIKWKDIDGYVFLDTTTIIVAGKSFSIPICLPDNYNLTVKRASSYNVAGSFLAVLTGAHLAHLLGGLIALLITAINIKRNKYTKENHLGFDLTAIYWHFLGLLWIYLFCFLKFF